MLIFIKLHTILCHRDVNSSIYKNLRDGLSLLLQNHQNEESLNFMYEESITAFILTLLLAIRTLRNIY